ncbi:hypothetical protein DPMN_052165 [Dreissena polymorpha]|uniref:Uncharacterized protein n=1 Tax=Dreissena polymorpha TaxID=45954 RepID=A0A9D4CL76_DREPO|nr:hypothetical protein DPMN_052165 [Dreissena polymorpha]
MNPLTKFHKDRTLNVATRVPYNHVFQANVTIFELIHDINKTNLLTIFLEDWTINVASRVLTRKNALPPGGNVFQPKGIISELFHEDWTMNVASRVTIFKLIHDIIVKNLLSKFHKDRKINVASRMLTMFYFSYIGKKCPAPWQPYQTINVASRVLTRFYYSHIRKNAPPLGSHAFQANVTIFFELNQDIIETNLLTKFHDDWKQIQMLTVHDARRTKSDHKSSKSHHKSSP